MPGFQRHRRPDQGPRDLEDANGQLVGGGPVEDPEMATDWEAMGSRGGIGWGRVSDARILRPVTWPHSRLLIGPRLLCHQAAGQDFLGLGGRALDRNFGAVALVVVRSRSDWSPILELLDCHCG